MITVHGRTRNQMFKGKADWSFIKVKQVVKIPVVVNGDVNEINDYFESKFKSSCDAVMIGRGHMEDHGYLKKLNIFKTCWAKI